MTLEAPRQTKKDQIIAFIAGNPGRIMPSDIAKMFGVSRQLVHLALNHLDYPNNISVGKQTTLTPELAEEITNLHKQGLTRRQIMDASLATEKIVSLVCTELERYNKNRQLISAAALRHAGFGNADTAKYLNLPETTIAGACRIIINQRADLRLRRKRMTSNELAHLDQQVVRLRPTHTIEQIAGSLSAEDPRINYYAVINSLNRSMRSGTIKQKK